MNCLVASGCRYPQPICQISIEKVRILFNSFFHATKWSFLEIYVIPIYPNSPNWLNIKREKPWKTKLPPDRHRPPRPLTSVVASADAVPWPQVHKKLRMKNCPLAKDAILSHSPPKFHFCCCLAHFFPCFNGQRSPQHQSGTLNELGERNADEATGSDLRLRPIHPGGFGHRHRRDMLCFMWMEPFTNKRTEESLNG